MDYHACRASCCFRLLLPVLAAHLSRCKTLCSQSSSKETFIELSSLHLRCMQQDCFTCRSCTCPQRGKSFLQSLRTSHNLQPVRLQLIAGPVQRVRKAREALYLFLFCLWTCHFKTPLTFRNILVSRDEGLQTSLFGDDLFVSDGILQIIMPAAELECFLLAAAHVAFASGEVGRSTSSSLPCSRLEKCSPRRLPQLLAHEVCSRGISGVSFLCLSCLDVESWPWRLQQWLQQLHTVRH